MRVNGKKQRLDYNCSAGVSGSFTTIQQMSLFKRNPLTTISENTENNISVKCKSFDDLSATHLELECHEELNTSEDPDPVECVQYKKYWRSYFQSTDSPNLVDIFNQIYQSEVHYLKK
ncbi:hypothetical protein MXB_1222 [Myxobolus squamalis]|nr:hypothetical protein MXB_1222 [Myxobolus squamalis]